MSGVRLRAAALGAAVAGLLAAAEPEVIMDLRDWPVRVAAGEAQLFIDDYLIARQSGVAFRLHRPEKHPANPLIVPTAPWEHLVLCYGSVLQERVLRFWYTNDTGIAYAESRDGLRWEKPPVGLEVDGHRTNILTRGHRGRSDTLSVLLNPNPLDAARKYLAYPFEYRFPDKDGVRETLREGLYLRTSPDGIHWTGQPEPVMYSIWRHKEDRPGNTTAGLGDVNHISWDPKLGKFIGHIKISFGGVRTRGLVESDDGIHWTKPHLILRADDRDRPGDQLYSMIAFPYESVWLAYLGLYHKESGDQLDIQLAVSHDGRHWTRPLRETFVPNGAPGAFDEGTVHMAANPPLRIGDKLYLYYGGYGPVHNMKLRDLKQVGIGVATLRPHGFVSLHAAGEPGRVVTRPLDTPGSRLHLNAAVRPGGAIRVRALDAAYRPVAGLESAAITGEGLDIPVRWTSGGALPARVRLEFELREADLYSFWID